VLLFDTCDDDVSKCGFIGLSYLSNGDVFLISLKDYDYYCFGATSVLDRTNRVVLPVEAVLLFEVKLLLLLLGCCL